MLVWTDPDNNSIAGWEYQRKTGDGDYGEWIPIPNSGAGTAEHTVENLDNGKTYMSSGYGRWPTPTRTTARPPTKRRRRWAPARPKSFTATGGDGRVVLAWTDPGDDSIVRWEYRRKIGDGSYGDWIPIPNSDADTATYTVENLDNGAVHVFQARAVNDTGNGMPSVQATATPAPSPAAPEGFTATAGDGRVVLAWTDPDDGSITWWEYRRKTGDGDYGDWIFIPKSNADTTKHKVENLDNGVAHVFQVRAVNDTGNGAASDEATATMAPAAPEDFTVTPGDGEVVLAWTDPDDAGIVRWEYRRKTGDGDYGEWIPIPNSEADTATYTVENIDNDVVHVFQVRAVNATGNGNPTDPAITAPVPNWPDDFTATGCDWGAVLAWTDPGDDSIVRWEYRRKAGDGDYGEWIPIPNSDADTTEYTVENLDNGKTYIFQVRAVNALGNGVASDTAKATPRATRRARSAPAQPENLRAVPGNGLVRLQWRLDPDGVGIAEWWQYRQKPAGGDYGDWIVIPNSDAATATMEYTVENLDNGKTYVFQVRAVTATRTGPPSAEATALVGLSGLALTNVMANPQTVILGESSTIAWTPREDVVRVYIGGGGLLDVVTEGNEHVVEPTETGVVTYTLSAEDIEGAPLGDFTVEVWVVSVSTWADDPVLTNAMANPRTVVLGESSTIAWLPREDVARVHIGGGGLLDVVAEGSEHVVEPTEIGVVAYTLSAEDDEGAPLGDFTVEVWVVPTWADVPALRSVVASPVSIGLGESSTIAWMPREDVVRVYIGGGGLLDVVTEGSEHVVEPTEIGVVAYTLSAEDDEGAPLGEFSVEVAVMKPPPPPPVNRPPVAADDTVAGAWGADADIPAATLLANDTDPDGDTLTVAAVGDAAGGTATLSGGAIAFAHDGKTGEGVGFTYTVSDGRGGTDTAAVTVAVSKPNEAPVAGDDTVAGAWGADAEIPAATLLANDTDPDGDTLTVAAVGDAAGGTATLSGGAIAFAHDGKTGEGVGFTYTVSDGRGGTDTAAVTVAVSKPNEAPVAGDDTVAGAWGADAEIPAATLLANDTDPDGDELTVAAVGDAAGGTATLSGGAIAFAHDGKTGEGVGFTYTVSDGRGGTDTAAVTVAVSKPNEAPVAGDDTVAGAWGADAEIPAATLLANDTDPDGDELTVAAVGDAVGGTATLSGDTIAFAHDGKTGEGVGFTYTVGDGRGGTDTAAVTVAVSKPNEAPVAGDDTVAGAWGADAEIPAATLLANDTDPDGDELTVAAVGDAVGGTATLSGDTIAFAHDGKTGEGVGFTYTVGDGRGGTDTAAVTVAVSKPNEAPAFTQTSYAFDLVENRAGPVDIGTVRAEDPDAEDAVSYTLSGSDRFEIDGTSGTIAYVGSGEDHERVQSYALTLAATDGELTDDAALTVAIIDVEEPPARPEAPSVSAAGSGALQAIWTEPANTGPPISGYDTAYRAQGSPDWLDGPTVARTSATLGGLDSNSVHEVRVRARNDEGVSPWSEPGRASTETAVLSVAYGAERYPVAEGGAAEVTVVLDPPADRDVLIPVVVSPARGGLSGVPESVSFARGESERTFAVRGEPDEDDADERAVLGFGALPANVAAGTPSQAAVTVVDDDKAVAGRIERINEALLGRQAMSIVDDLNLAVQSRARALVSGEAAAARPPSLGGHSTWAGLLESNARALGEGRWDPVRLMGNSSFLLPLNAAGDACAGWRCGGTLWGTGNHHDLSGGEDGLDWDGDVLAVQIGADLQMGSNLVAGASVSWSEGSFDYRDGSDGTSGRYGSEMTSLHPYFGWASDDGLLVWGSLGVGNGDIEADEAGRARQRSDTALSAFSLGASGELMARGAAADGGRASLRLKGEATAAEVEVDGGGLIRASAVDGTRLRLGLEYGVLRTLSGNGLLDTSVEVGVRRDSGFDDGAGVEVGAGLEWTDASRGLTVGARARALAGGDHDEWGAHLSIRLAAGRDGRGASFTLRPAYGVTASGVRRLWDRGVSGPVRDRAGMEARMEAEIGYGMARWGGLFTPYGALGAGPSQRLYRAGGRFEMGARWHLDVEVEQRGGGALGADRGIRLTGQWGLGGDRTTDKAQGSTGSQPPPMRMRADRRLR